MHIIKWNSGEAKGYSDLLPEGWFTEEKSWLALNHAVEGPRKGRYVARCKLTVRGNIADLDYGGVHTEFNEDNFEIGVMQLIFADDQRRTIDGVLWKDAGPGKRFAPADVDVSKASVAIDELDEFDPKNSKDGRRKIERLVAIRQGQPMFRMKLMDAYERRCAITRCTIEDTLQAAHISPYRGDHSNHVTNGLLLRADIHTLFDRGLIRVDGNFRVIASDAVRAIYHDLPDKIKLPAERKAWPSREALQQKFAAR